MSRPRKRMLLDNGIRFDVNVMVRAGLKTATCKTIVNTQEIAADLRVDDRDWRGKLRFRHPDFDQTIGCRLWRGISEGASGIGSAR